MDSIIGARVTAILDLGAGRRGLVLADDAGNIWHSVRVVDGEPRLEFLRLSPPEHTKSPAKRYRCSVCGRVVQRRTKQTEPILCWECEHGSMGCAESEHRWLIDESRDYLARCSVCGEVRRMPPEAQRDKVTLIGGAKCG